MAYAGLGYRPSAGVADSTGMNTGNYTVSFPPNLIGSNIPYFELYHFYVQSPLLAGGNQASVQVALNMGLWDYNLIATGNGWDPAQPMILTPGDTIYFYFDVPVSIKPAPVVTAWFRYDTTFSPRGAPL